MIKKNLPGYVLTTNNPTPLKYVAGICTIIGGVQRTIMFGLVVGTPYLVICICYTAILLALRYVANINSELLVLSSSLPMSLSLFAHLASPYPVLLP